MIIFVLIALGALYIIGRRRRSGASLNVDVSARGGSKSKSRGLEIVGRIAPATTAVVRIHALGYQAGSFRVYCKFNDEPERLPSDSICYGVIANTGTDLDNRAFWFDASKMNSGLFTTVLGRGPDASLGTDGTRVDLHSVFDYRFEDISKVNFSLYTEKTGELVLIFLS